jgi:hypothetical protein
MTTRCLALLCLLAACAPTTPAPLPEGTWTGGLTPMNHPDVVSPLTYEVRRAGEELALTLVSEDVQTPARDVEVAGDTLSFVFNEPEAGVLLTCALARQADASYAGRCVDAGGKWAHFTMKPPED